MPISLQRFCSISPDKCYILGLVRKQTLILGEKSNQVKMATNRKYQTLVLRYWHYPYRAHQPSTGGVIDKYYYLFLWRNCVERNKSSWKRIILYNIDSAFNMLVCQTEAKTTYRINDTSWFICLAYIDLKFFLIQKT